MSFTWDGEGLETEPWLIAEEGEKCLVVKKATEKKSKADDPQVEIDFVVVGGKDDGKEVRHYVTFLPKSSKGAGMAAHWLSLMGEKPKGLFQASKWVGRHVLGYIKHEAYQGKNKNTVAWLDEWKGDLPKTAQKLDDLEEIPF